MTDRTTSTAAPASAGDLRHDAYEHIYDGNGRAAWGAIFAGTVVALGLYVVLSLVGIGLGLSLFEPTEASPMNGSLTTTAIWQFVSQLVALGVGGFVAGRLAGVLHSTGSMLHGLTVWALTTLAAVWLATSAAMGIVNVAGSAVSGLASGAGSAVQAVIPDDLSLPDFSNPSMSLEDLPAPLQRTLRQNGITPENFQAEAREAFRAVISEQEQADLRDEATTAVQEAITSPGDIGQAADDFISNVFGRGGILSAEDEQEALAVMQRRFGVTEEQATQYLDAMGTRVEEVQAQAEQAIEDARAAATQAADAAADATATAAWLAALASLLGLAAAVGGAVAGRPARG